jgi:uncharacterized protein (UPF0335 family)
MSKRNTTRAIKADTSRPEIRSLVKKIAELEQRRLGLSHEIADHYEIAREADYDAGTIESMVSFRLKFANCANVRQCFDEYVKAMGGIFAE